MPPMKRTIKDSVFTLMFKEPEYALQLYQVFHPEDKGVTEKDIQIITLENILTVGEYNDLGMLVRNTLLMLTEAQTTFSLNICPRVLLYLAKSYKEYIDKMKLDIYSTKAIALPRPELYMVYTGSKQDVPDVLHLSDLYEGTGSVDIHIKVIRGTGSRDILDQYVRFCEIVDENRKKYGLTQKAVEETLRQCREEGILVPFLASREKEVRDIMVTLFDEERIWEIHDYNVRKESRAEGMEQGIKMGEEKGIEKGVEQGIAKSLRSLMETLGFSIEQAMSALKLPEADKAKYQAMLDS